MASGKSLSRNVRAHRPTVNEGHDERDDSVDISDDDAGSSIGHSLSEDGVDESIEDAGFSNCQDGEDGDEKVDVQQSISQVSFGALKQAQDSYSRKRKRGSDGAEDQEQKLQALRARLQQIKQEKGGVLDGPTNDKSSKHASGHIQRNTRSDYGNDMSASGDSDSDSDSAPSEEGAPTKNRSSKHAPTSQSTRHQVTRKRTVVEVRKRNTRDPRFDALSRNPTQHAGNTEKAYEFLRDYQKSEIAELQSAIKLTRNSDEKEILRKKMVSMQNRLKAKENDEREQAVLRRHRKEEREKVLQGKTPYYMKKKDVKEAALVDKFKEMKGKDRQKLMDRRRKKESQKEKKRMPEARRFAG